LGFTLHFLLAPFVYALHAIKKDRKNRFQTLYASVVPRPVLANSLPTAKNNTKAKAKTAATKCILTLHR